MKSLLLACVLTAYLFIPVTGDDDTRLLPDENLSQSEISSEHKCVYICEICAEDLEACINSYCGKEVDPAAIAKIVCECRDLETLKKFV